MSRFSPPPRCEDCGTHHHAHQAHVFSAPPSRATSKVAEEKPSAVRKSAPRAKPAVVDAASAVVDTVVDGESNRSRDRHKKSAARRNYLRVKQRESRARRAARKAA